MHSSGSENRAPKSGRIPSLDGLRAISIFIVLLSHASLTVNFRQLPKAHVLYAFGPFGVKVFFVISGFLITTLLLKEERARGRISIGQFYFRRAFRILPVAYLFAGTLAVLAACGVIFLPPYNLLFVATFTMNFVRSGSWMTGHLWSLAVEEQFYLLWPLLFLVAGPRLRRLGCALLILLAPALRTLAYLYAPVVYDVMQESLLFLGDSIAIGCLLALESPRLKASARVRAFIESRWVFIAPLFACASYATLNHNIPQQFYLAIGESVCLVSIAVTIWRVINYEDFFTRILNSRVMVAAGVLSYSLYIWQQIFLNIFSTAWVNRFPQNIVLACAAAIVSYRFVETPFLRLRERISARRTLRQRGQTGALIPVAEHAQPVTAGSSGSLRDEGA